MLPKRFFIIHRFSNAHECVLRHFIVHNFSLLIVMASIVSRVLQGGREVADFIKYIKENATNPPVIAGEEEKKKKKKAGKSKEEL